MMTRHFGVKPLIAVVVGFAAIQSNAQFELTHHYVTNDTSSHAFKSLVEHYSLDLSQYQFMTYSDSIYDALTWGQYQVTGYHLFPDERASEIEFSTEGYNPGGPRSRRGYVLVEEIDYVDRSFRRDRTSIYIFN